ncbi:MAG: undecaprenyldiphospho-muramoylpentapeptide beta-N-acetylglucosaminyltransferase [Pseudomonadota bacterium]|jgi:UDP-N-acetylglucosamine--N-acetylmuramyl-(pentapeptide) pyrophosphoryl-undecaprenol N-acetylglucosamine transferase|nr:undecaprenyldiphospho-muramoylpentapeptide beta-N-acetylglucosaminyltransferase [Pseudomonadota bacterium]
MAGTETKEQGAAVSGEKPLILIMAGGTGGHVFPAIAVAKVLMSRGCAVEWLGTRGRMEEKIVPKNGIKLNFIKVQGLRRNGIMRKLGAPFMLARSLFECLSLLRHLRPKAVVGFGGYASGPGAVAAKLLGIPVIIHEQNASPGLTNRLIAKFCNKVLLGFPGAIQRSDAIVTGNPVRAEIEALAARPLSESPKGTKESPVRISVIGGSLGCAFFNEHLPEVFKSLGDSVVITHQTGAGNSEKVRAKYHTLGMDSVKVSDFIDDMAGLFSSTDLLFARSGALTVAEASAAHVPAVFVPYPFAVDDHQTKNAESLVKAGGAAILQQSDFSAEKAAQIIRDIISGGRLPAMAEALRKNAVLRSAEKIAGICMDEAGIASAG